MGGSYKSILVKSNDLYPSHLTPTWDKKTSKKRKKKKKKRRGRERGPGKVDDEVKNCILGLAAILFLNVIINTHNKLLAPSPPEKTLKLKVKSNSDRFWSSDMYF